MAILNKLLRFGIYAAIFLGALVCSLYLTSKWIIQSEEEVLVFNNLTTFRINTYQIILFV